MLQAYNTGWKSSLIYEKKTDLAEKTMTWYALGQKRVVDQDGKRRREMENGVPCSWKKAQLDTFVAEKRCWTMKKMILTCSAPREKRDIKAEKDNS